MLMAEEIRSSKKSWKIGADRTIAWFALLIAFLALAVFGMERD